MLSLKTPEFPIFSGPENFEPAAAVVDYRAERNFARAAEYLVAFDISRRGFDCYTVGESLRYDLIADIGGLRRIQVKQNRRSRRVSRSAAARQGYIFGQGHGDLREYVGDVDLFAFVAMDRRLIIYVEPSKITRAHLWVPAATVTPEGSDRSWHEAMDFFWNLKTSEA